MESKAKDTEIFINVLTDFINKSKDGHKIQDIKYSIFDGIDYTVHSALIIFDNCSCHLLIFRKFTFMPGT